MLENKLRTYSSKLRSMIKEEEVRVAKAGGPTDATEREKELSYIVKEKNKQIKVGETAQKNLAKRLSELENNVGQNKTELDDKYKKVNDKLSVKTKEAKKMNDDLRKAEKGNKELHDSVAQKNKNISELESENTRLRLMKD